MRPVRGFMAFREAFRTLNTLKRKGLIRDYVVIGAVGVMAYVEPVQTGDLDIVILVDSDDEYIGTFRKLSVMAEERDHMHLFFGNVPVQIFPTTVSPLYREVLEGARTVRVGNLRVKVASPEHLIIMALTVYRDTDRLRIGRLLPMADRQRVRDLLARFDDSRGTLAGRIRALL